MSKASLAKKLVKILGEAQKVKKSGMNNHAKYQYTTESDLLELIRPKLVEAGIFISTSIVSSEVIKTTTSKGNDNLITTVITEHTFIDSESGEELKVQSAGQGADQQDKGIYKAITGATKYMLWKNFLVESNDDPENDNANAGYVRTTGAKASNTTNTTSTKRSFKSLTNTSEEKTEAAPKVEEKKEEVVKETAPTKRTSFGNRSFKTQSGEAKF